MVVVEVTNAILKWPMNAVGPMLRWGLWGSAYLQRSDDGEILPNRKLTQR